MLHETYDEDCEPIPSGVVTPAQFRASDPYSKELLQKAREALTSVSEDIGDLDAIVSSLRLRLSVPSQFLKAEAPYARAAPGFLLTSE